MAVHDEIVWALSSNGSLLTMPVHISDNDNSQAMLEASLIRISKNRITHVVIMTSTHNTIRVLQMTTTLGMVNWLYYIILPEHEDPDPLLSFLLAHDWNVRIIARYWRRCPEHVNIIRTKEANRTNSGYHWISNYYEAILADGITLVYTAIIADIVNRSLLGTVDHNFTCLLERLQLMVQKGCNTNSNMTHTQCGSRYEFSTMVGGNVAEIGSWSSHSGLKLTNSLALRNTYYDFGGAILNVSTVQLKPFEMATNEKTSLNDTLYIGFCIDVMDELARRLNFRYRMIEPVDQQFGAPGLGNKSWTGIVGMVQTGEAHMGAGPITVMLSRATVIDFLAPLDEMPMGLMTRQFNERSLLMFRLFVPFSVEVWAALVGAVIFVGAVSCFINVLTPNSAFRRGIKGSTKDEVTLKGNMWLIFSSFMDQDLEYYPHSVSGMVLLGFWWMFRILIVASYTANLVALLTVSIPRQPINSVEELAAQSDITPIWLAGSSHETVIRDTEVDTFQKIWEMSTGEVNSPDQDYLLDKVRMTGRYALISDMPLIEYASNVECNMFVVGEKTFFPTSMAFIVPENAPYAEAMNYNIRQMREAGLILRWKQHWWKKNMSCSAQSPTTGTSLGTDSLGGVFIVNAAVAGVAMFLLVFEKVLWKQVVEAYRQCRTSNIRTTQTI